MSKDIVMCSVAALVNRHIKSNIPSIYITSNNVSKPKNPKNQRISSSIKLKSNKIEDVLCSLESVKKSFKNVEVDYYNREQLTFSFSQNVSDEEYSEYRRRLKLYWNYHLAYEWNKVLRRITTLKRTKWIESEESNDFILQALKNIAEKTEAKIDRVKKAIEQNKYPSYHNDTTERLYTLMQSLKFIQVSIKNVPHFKEKLKPYLFR